jgi:hypothetical protein
MPKPMWLRSRFSGSNIGSMRRALCTSRGRRAVPSLEVGDRAGAHHIVQFTTALEVPPA